MTGNQSMTGVAYSWKSDVVQSQYFRASALQCIALYECSVAACLEWLKSLCSNVDS